MSVWETVAGVLKKAPLNIAPELTQVETDTTTNGITQRLNKLDVKSLISENLINSLKMALTECALPRGDLINFVHKHSNLINEGFFEFDKTMLHLAAGAGNLEVVKWLISKGARVDVLDSQGSSPISIASIAGEVEVASYLKSVPLKTTLKVLLAGAGKGVVTNNLQQETYGFGSRVRLRAAAEPGSVFVGWSGDLNETAASCTVVMDADKVLTATFARQAFPLIKSVSGSGSGTVTCTPEAESYQPGCTVTLTAQPAEGSIFTGWVGDATGFDSRCTVVIDSVKHIVAEFQKIEVPDLEVAVSFDSIEDANMKSGDEAFIVHLAIANKGKKQIRIELPLASYLTHQGEEIEQDAWLSGLLNGGQGASIRAGAFRKIGLVFFKQKLKCISTGDQLLISVARDKPAQRCNYILRCIDDDPKAFVLTHAELDKEISAEASTVIPEVVAPPADSAEILQRIGMLQTTLDEVLRQLANLQTATRPVIQQSMAQPEPALPVSSHASPRTLRQVLTWLVMQERVSAAELRDLLLPLNLLPYALMDQINERALDMVGEPALEDCDDDILVTQEVLAAILTDWDALNLYPDHNKG